MEPLEALKQLYYDPATGFASATALHKRAKQQGVKVSLAKVKAWLTEQETAQVFHRSSVKHHFPLVSYGPFNRIQIDLADVSQLARWNGGVKFIFCAIDVYTRFAFVVPLKSKNDTEVLTAWKQIVERIVERTHFPPSQLDSDRESAFLSRNFKAYCEKLGITQKLLPVSDYKGTAVVDRWIRTLRELLNRYMVAYNTKSYVGVLDELVQNYNTRINQGIRRTPEQASDPSTRSEYDEHYWRLMGDRVQRAQGEAKPVKVGDKVRVLLRKQAFEKGTTQKWSSTTHLVESMSGGLYHVSGRVSGYKPYELQVIVGGKVHHLDIAHPDAVAQVAQEAKAEEVDRRITRRIAKEGVERNERPGPTDEEKSERAIRGRKQRDLGPYLQ